MQDIRKKMEYPIIYHGSENSLDIDAYVIIPKILDHKEAKKLCDSYKKINANLLVVENGQVVWSYKGTIDECNNSILATYHLHQQNHPCPITEKSKRQYGLKMVRSVRGLLSYNSRTQHREDVKKSLMSADLNLKMNTLRNIDLTQILDFEKTSLVETYKFFAFQMGQTLALLKDDVELFTKNSVAQYYPQLKDYLDRKPSDAINLQNFYKDFIDYLSTQYKKVEHHILFYTQFHGIKEVLDCKKEMTLPPVVIFDIDGTLMDESHRKEHRDNKNWDVYFSLCDLDTPIKEIIALTKEYKQKGYEIWLMTGRVVTCEEKTRKSLLDNGAVFDHLKMRAKGVFLPDYTLKPAWVGKYIGKERVEIIYDDRQEVIDGFRKKGLNVIDVKTLIHKEEESTKFLKIK